MINNDNFDILFMLRMQTQPIYYASFIQSIEINVSSSGKN